MALLPKSTCKWVDHCTACVSVQEVMHGVGVALSTASPAWNCGIHCRLAGAHGLPPVGQITNCGIYPAASASFEHRGIVDFMPV
jgi:hypothetical protein